MVATASQLTSDQEQLDYLDTVFAKQRKAFNSAPYPSLQQRKKDLDSLKDVILEFKDQLADAINEDFSCRSKDETMLAEVMVTLEGIKYNRARMKKWMKPSKRHVSYLFQPASNRVQYQPKGVVGIIVPWNYPLQLALAPLTGALTAGNSAIIKMSEFTPKTNEVMKTMLAKAFPEEKVAVVTGEAEVGAAFSAKHWDHLIFTGSTAVGRHVMAAAGKNLVPVTLELGGKSPTIIGTNANMKDAANCIVFGKATNAGQTCIAPDYILCPRHRVEELKSALAESYKECFPTLRDNNDYTAIVNDRQHARLQGVLSDAQTKGAKVTVLNHANEDFSGTRKIPLTLVEDTKEEMTIRQDEIFGPLLPILTYDKLEEALTYIKERPRPLALYYFGPSKAEQNYILETTHAGGVTINNTLVHVAQDDMPFGGVGDSGIGGYHGHEGFLTFSHGKSVHVRGPINSSKFIYPPHGRLMHRLIYKFILR